MRRQLLGRHTPTQGFSDSFSPLSGRQDMCAEGSFGLLFLGEEIVRPFHGYFTQGLGTGSQIMTPLAATYGGLRNYSTVTAQGSLIEDFSKTLYTIGAGEVTKEGIPIDIPTLAFTFDPGDVNTSNGTITETSHGLTTGEPIYITNSVADPPAGLSEETAYFSIVLTANTFRLALTYKNSLAGTPIVPTDQGTGVNSLFWGAGDPLRASTIMQVASEQVATYFYRYFDQAGLGVVETPLVSVPTAPTANYTGLVNGAVNFKIAAMRDRQNVGVNIDNPSAPVKGNASAATAVVVPVNGTVKIVFPNAITGQTHWAVFSTQQGFGGTGNFFRLGYRTSSDPDATWYYGISEATVAAAVNRTLEFDYRTGDLLPEVAWIQSYPPPPGTHCVRLENIMVVLGAYDGSVGAVSLPNEFEDYNPFHLLYFPEPVTAVLSRQIDNYAFIACRNSIHTVQYVGYRGDELPSATITTITPEIGITHQHNWCQGGGNIAMWIEGAGIALMHNDGQIDLEFGKEVAYFTRDWVASGVVVSFDPNTRSFVFGYQGQSVSYCLQSGAWSDPVYLTDCGFSSTTWTSAINAQGRLYVSLTTSGTATAYKYDDGSSTTRMPICTIGNWVSTDSPARGTGLYEAQATVGTHNTPTEPVVMVVHKNLVTPYIRGCSVTSGQDLLTAPSNVFTSGGTTGSYVAIFGTGIGTGSANYIVARATYENATQVRLSNPITGAQINAAASFSSCFVLWGAYAYALTLAQFQPNQSLPSIRPAIQDARTFCVSAWMATDAIKGAIWQMDIFGRQHETSAIGTTLVS